MVLLDPLYLVIMFLVFEPLASIEMLRISQPVLVVLRTGFQQSFPSCKPNGRQDQS
jgi:hypothetical protein